MKSIKILEVSVNISIYLSKNPSTNLTVGPPPFRAREAEFVPNLTQAYNNCNYGFLEEEALNEPYIS